VRLTGHFLAVPAVAQGDGGQRKGRAGGKKKKHVRNIW
jgi:hypothetical protein